MRFKTFRVLQQNYLNQISVALLVTTPDTNPVVPRWDNTGAPAQLSKIGVQVTHEACYRDVDMREAWCLMSHLRCICGPEEERPFYCHWTVSASEALMQLQNKKFPFTSRNLKTTTTKKTKLSPSLTKFPTFQPKSQQTAWWGGPHTVIGIVTRVPLPLLFSAHKIFIRRDRLCCAVSSSCHNLLHNRDFSEF